MVKLRGQEIKVFSGNANAALYVIAACMVAASLLVFRVPARLVDK